MPGLAVVVEVRVQPLAAVHVVRHVMHQRRLRRVLRGQREVEEEGHVGVGRAGWAHDLIDGALSSMAEISLRLLSDLSV